jgi:nucleoredoxin
MEVMRDGRATGAVGLRAGETLTLVELKDDVALVRYRNLNGRVPIARTNLPALLAAAGEMPAPKTEAPVVVAPAKRVESAPAVTIGPREPAGVIERALTGKLVRLADGKLREDDAARLAGVKFYALYFSASWCPPCREFTPGFVDAYNKLRALYPELEVVLVCADRSAGDMLKYMQTDHMTWAAVKFDLTRSLGEINRYCGDGIPCLVLVDANGKVLSDTNRWGRYVGPDTVLDDTWKILRDYRRKNPRVKS